MTIFKFIFVYLAQMVYFVCKHTYYTEIMFSNSCIPGTKILLIGNLTPIVYIISQLNIRIAENYRRYNKREHCNNNENTAKHKINLATKHFLKSRIKNLFY